MARLKAEVAEKKKVDAKDLFISGKPPQAISELIDVSVNTINKWKREGDWDMAKKVQNLTISSIRTEILETFSSLKNGEEPKVSADKLSKLVSAFEKISDKKKNVAYMYESFKSLSDEMANEVTLSKKKDKDFKLQAYQYTRSLMDKLTEKAYMETL